MSSIRLSVAMAALVTLSACALPRERGYLEMRTWVEDASGHRPPAPRALGSAPVPARPVTAADAVRLALLHHPRVRSAFADIGMARGDWEDAARLSNPSFAFLSLAPTDGASTITRALAMSLSDALLLPARKRFASGELERAQAVAAAELLELAYEAESAWYEAVGAAQIAAMRAIVAKSANAAESLALRFFEAGNISRLQLELERAAAAQARIEAIDASAAALRARASLAAFIGQRSSGPWTLADKLSAPPDARFDVDQLIARALDQRLDLRAARQAVRVREDALKSTRRWRWLGAVEVGGEREREASGERLSGPSVQVEVPLFSQSQGQLERAQAELHAARATLDGLLVEVHNDAASAVDALDAARDIADRYARELVPQREAIVARTQEEVNFMLVGVFDLLQAKQQEYDAYQAYLEAVRDYWIARARLRRAVGGRLPDDDAIGPGTLGVDAVLPEAAHDPHAGHGSSSGRDVDPHAHHHRHERADEPRDESQRRPEPAPAEPIDDENHRSHPERDKDAGEQQ